MSPPDKTPPIINEWVVLAHPVFARRYVALRDDVLRLKGELTADAYRRRPTVKLFAALWRLITEIVPQDPNAPEYMLRGPLARYRRAKGRGLPPRYRLFWIFSTQAKAIIFLYINDEATLLLFDDRSSQRSIPSSNSIGRSAFTRRRGLVVPSGCVGSR